MAALQGVGWFSSSGESKAVWRSGPEIFKISNGVEEWFRKIVLDPWRADDVCSRKSIEDCELSLRNDRNILRDPPRQLLEQDYSSKTRLDSYILFLFFTKEF